MAKKISAYPIEAPYKKILGDLADDLWKARAGILFGSKTHDFASTVDAAGLTTTVVVPGAELGDFAFASVGVSLVDTILTAYVSAADTVSVRFQNESGSTLDLASTTLRVFVVPRRAVATVFGSSALYLGSTLDVASLVDGAGSTPTGVTVTGAALGDFVFASHGVDLAGVTISPSVQAADTVEIRFQNESTATVDLASTVSRVVVVPAASLYQAFKGKVLTNSATYDAASLADATGATATVTVGGAQLGDFAFASLSLDNQDIVVSAYVSAANTVSVRLQQENAGSAVDLASLTIRAGVVPRAFVESIATQSLVR